MPPGELLHRRRCGAPVRDRAACQILCGRYEKLPLPWLIPALACAGFLDVIAFGRRTRLAFVASSVACLSVILTAGVALFPFVLPSSSTPAASLTAWDACSSYTALDVMFWVAVIFAPIVLAYTGWADHAMSGKVTREYIAANDKTFIELDTEVAMWYFTWVFGLGFAVLLAILNALWFEDQDARDKD